MKYLLPTLLIISFLGQLYAQPITFSIEDFVLTGDAVHTSDNCFQLTEAQTWQGGAVWYASAVNLNDPFQMEIDVSFGCKNEIGADGIVFIFHPELTTGYAGEGMGFGRLVPSLGIEMDTYENDHLDDPSEDHVSLMRHGRLHHYYGLTDPVPLNIEAKNVEDCGNHRVKINWNPNENLLLFYFDGALRIRKKIDIVEQIFGGDPIVYWGFSSATGGMVNRHLVCLESLEFTTAIVLDRKTEKGILNGETYIFKNLDFRSGGYQLPKNAMAEIDLLVPVLKKDKNRSILLTGYTDSSGNDEKNLELSNKRAKAIAEYLKHKGIPSKRIIYNGFGEENPIAPNDTEQGRKKNRRVELSLIANRV